jgi:DNA-binding transcriptional regulator YhcF (GntR family)
MSGKTSQTRPRGIGRPPRQKARKRSIIAFEMVRFDRASVEPLHQQLYRQIRLELETGSFRNGSWRLPSSRALATDLGISRFTVKLAFSKLHAEGYLRSEVGSGTFAADPLPETLLRAGKPNGRPEVERPPRVSERVRKIPDRRTGTGLYAFVESENLDESIFTDHLSGLSAKPPERHSSS